MTIKEALVWAEKELKNKEVEGPRASAEFLLRQILAVDKPFLLAHPEKRLNLFQEKKFKKWINRRAKHEPVWYITGKIEFYGQDFFVNQNVLIPRPETELMIEKVLSMLSSLATNQGSSRLSVLDLGTGSGAIILSLARTLPPSVIPGRKPGTQPSLRDDDGKRIDSWPHTRNDKGAEFFASDISAKALNVAKRNAKNLSLENSVTFKKGDLFGPWVGQKFDLIVANLPYVPHEDMGTLAFDLTHYEPRTALDGGVAGLEIYQRFFDELPAFVNENALIFCEIGAGQGEPIKKMAKRAFPKARVKVSTDYGSFDRIIEIVL